MNPIKRIALAAFGAFVVWPGTVLALEREHQPNRVAALEPGTGPLVLVKAGRPVATIVIRTNATRTVRYAVKELNEHLELSTGTKLPVAKDGEPVTGPTIQVGATELAERFGLAPRYLALDNWVVTRAGQAVIISGGDGEHEKDAVSNALVPFGTLYAAYEFLERVVGVRWYWPGDLGRVVPQHRDLTVAKVHWSGAPTFDARFCFYGVHDDADLTTRDVWTWWRRMRRGTQGGSPIGMHAFNDWPGRFGKTHPEWFALQRAGHRLTQAGQMGGHVCFSNPDVLTQMIADKRKEFEKNPWQRYTSVMPGDGLDLHVCQCPACQAKIRPERGRGGKHSDWVWSFVNLVARDVRRSHPGRIITCCSYSGYSDVPEGPLEPNVSVTLTIGSSSQHLASSSKARASYLARIEKWAEKTPNVYVWDYWNNPRFSKGTYGAPTIFPHMIQDWLGLERGRVKGRVIELCQYNSEGINITGTPERRSWPDWMFDSLNAYVAFKLMWNLDQDVDAMLAEFYEAFYGPAGPWVRKFYDAMETAYMDPNNKSDGWNYRGVWGQVYPAAFVRETMGYLREAEQVSRGREPYHARAQKTLDGFLPFEATSARWTAALRRKIGNETLPVKAAAAAPTVDGVLSDPCWQTAAVAKEFCDSFNSVDLHAQTEMRFLHDGKTLYVAIRAPLSGLPPRRTLPAGSEDGTIWMADDSCELFFVDGVRKHQFVVGPDDIYTDNFHPDRTAKFTLDMLKWDCDGAIYRATTGENEWTAELAVPLASLELARPTKDKPWRVNFCRNHFYKENGKGVWQRELSTWRPTFGSFHNVERFGTMWLE
ncbi:MAG: DUF4838 domain-containing protein [Kiritimatiellae bacterium]|nr:DUF4838 domain-containing protein [Kiritimatiellia bacterium]